MTPIYLKSSTKADAITAAAQADLGLTTAGEWSGAYPCSHNSHVRLDVGITFVEAPAVYNDAGEIATPPVHATGYHWNALVDEATDEGAEFMAAIADVEQLEPVTPARVWA